jgi:hypothetical protein
VNEIKHSGTEKAFENSDLWFRHLMIKIRF